MDCCKWMELIFKTRFIHAIDNADSVFNYEEGLASNIIVSSIDLTELLEKTTSISLYRQQLMEVSHLSLILLKSLSP